MSSITKNTRHPLHGRRLAPRRSALALALLAAVAAPAFAQSVGTITNPGFETGDTSGWTTCGGKWYGGWPADETYCSGPATLAAIMNAGTFDSITGAPTVFAGSHSLRLNDQGNNYDLTALMQSVTNYGASKIYYAWNAVLEPSHGAEDSPSFIIKVVDKTTGLVVTNIAYSAYTAQNTSLFRDVNGYVTTDWKVEDIDVTAGHDYDMVFVAVDCMYGGHTGYIYVDGFGDEVPTPNGDVDFDPNTDVVQGSDILIPIGGKPDIDLAKPFYTTVELANDEVNPNFVGGTLQVDASTVGPVANAFTVQSQGGTVDTNGNDIVFSGAFTGVGGMTKIGLGTLTLSAISTINGDFDVNAGTLDIAGALSNHAVNVSSGGTLIGSGTVIAPINVNSGGVLNPGAAIGTLKVTGGNVTLNTGSTFALDIDGRTYSPTGGAGSYDRLALSGGSAGFVAGGTISPILRGIPGGNNTFTPVLGDFFTVVTADSVSGQFASVLQPTAGMPANRRFDVLYNPKNVQLVLTPASFATQGMGDGWKLDGIAAAAGLDAVRPTAGARNGNLQSLFNGLYGMTSQMYGLAFQQISGEIHAHNLLMANNFARETGTAVLESARGRIDQQCPAARDTQDAGAGKRDAACDDERNGPALWTRLTAQYSNAGETPAAYGFNADRYGVLAGLHIINNDSTRLGVGLGYAGTTLDSDIGSNAKAHENSLFVYAAHDFGALNLSGTVGWANADTDTKRVTALLTGYNLAQASYGLDTLYGAFEARYDFPLSDKTVIRPVAGLFFSNTKAKAVNETSTDPNQALILPEETWNTSHAKLGAEAEFGRGGNVQGLLFANWLHQIDGDSTASRAVHLGNASWRVASDALDDNGYDFGAALNVRLAPKTQLRLEYRGLRNGELSSNTGSVTVSVAL